MKYVHCGTTLTLLKNRRQWQRWKREHSPAYQGNSEPLEYPCYVGERSNEDFCENGEFLYIEQVKRMLNALTPKP